jgi:hypothetical protein
MAALRAKAEQGDVNAAREYREWRRMDSGLATINEDLLSLLSSSSSTSSNTGSGKGS